MQCRQTYERSERAAAAGHLDQAVAYDELTERDGRALPEKFADSYHAHTEAFIDQRFAALGTPTEANADSQDAAARGLLVWARGKSLKGDGQQRQTVVIGLGIGGGYDRPPWELGDAR